MVPWKPFSLSMVFLATIGGLHYWPLISRFASCSTSGSFIHMRWNVPVQWCWRPSYIRKLHCITSPPKLRLELCIFDTYVYCIIDPQCTWSWLWSSSCCRSTLYVWWMHSSWFIFIMDPHCISRGHDLVNGIQHGSAMYYWQLCLVVISKFI